MWILRLRWEFNATGTEGGKEFAVVKLVAEGFNASHAADEELEERFRSTTRRIQ